MQTNADLQTIVKALLIRNITRSWNSEFLV